MERSRNEGDDEREREEALKKLEELAELGGGLGESDALEGVREFVDPRAG